MANEADRGKAALERKDYHEAIECYSKALRTSESPLWYIQRSIAHQRNSDSSAALADADNAVLAAIGRGRRELIATGQLRRGIALHGLGRFGDARLCLHWTTKYNEKEKGLTIWVAKVKADYEKAGGEGVDCNKTSVKETPDKVESKQNSKENSDHKGKGKMAEGDTTPPKVEGESLAVDSVPALAVPTQSTTDKIRQEWYQSATTITIEILVKGVTKDKVIVHMSEGSLEVNFPLEASHSTYDYTITPLFAKINPTKSTSRVTPHKIEINLVKATAGKWASLEGTEPIVNSKLTEPTSKIPDSVLKEQTALQAKAPAYPTSSRTGPKNWDTVLSNEKEDEDDDGPDAFFKKLYKDADPDVKRAMMKSYQESNGTALSTNWSDVGKAKVKTVPPEGVEAKAWET